MAKIPTTPQGHEFHMRPGVDPFGPNAWRGVNTETDPGSLDPNELQWGENFRRQGKGLRSRSGLTQVVDLGTDAGSVMYFGALPSNNPRTRVWMSTLGAYGGSTVTGSGLAHYDPSEPIAFQHHSHYYRAADLQMPIAKFGTRLYIGDGDTLRELVDIRGSYGIEAIEAVPTPPVTPIVRIPGFTIRCMLEFNGFLFLGLEDDATPATSKIMAWDGLTLKTDISGIDVPVAFGIWRDKLVVGFEVGTGHIRSRAMGAIPGTWTTHALVGVETAISGNAMAECGANLFIAGGNTKLFKFDGTNVTLVRTIAGAAADGSGITSLTLHRGLLYYGWNVPITYNSRLGRFDPDSTATDWVDTYLDVTAAVPDFTRLSSLLSYRGQVYMGGRQVSVVASAMNDVMGTPEIVNDTGTPSTDFRIMQMLRFP